MMAMRIYAQQPIPEEKRRVDVTRTENVISVDFGREVRERRARQDAEDAKLRRANLIDRIIFSVVVAGLLSLVLHVIFRAFA